MTGKPQTFSKGQTKEVVGIVRRQLIGVGTLILLILGSFLGLSVWEAFEKVEEITETRIANQFKEPDISALLQRVAEKEAKSTLDEQLLPEVSRFKAQTANQLADFDAYMKDLRARYEKDYETLSKEVTVLKQRNDIARLGDLGTAEADRSALEQLEKIHREDRDESMRVAAFAEIARIKSFWANTTHLGGTEILVSNSDGTTKKEGDLKTAELVASMLHNRQWQVRALAAKALGKRKEKGVPEALLLGIQQDRHLEVVKWAAQSFARVTGRDQKDVFSFDDTASWWEENAEETNKKLKDAKPPQANEE